MCWRMRLEPYCLIYLGLCYFCFSLFNLLLVGCAGISVLGGFVSFVYVTVVLFCFVGWLELDIYILFAGYARRVSLIA